MPSVSKSQQRFFGAVKACKETGNCASEKIQKAADSMSKKQIDKFAKTKHKDLPEKKTDESFSAWLKNHP
jgi:hypothetical protein